MASKWLSITFFYKSIPIYPGKSRTIPESQLGRTMFLLTPSANVLAVRFRRTEKNPQTDVVGQTEQETQTDSDFRDNTAGKG